mgnify:CR=1 FL=1
MSFESSSLVGKGIAFERAETRESAVSAAGRDSSKGPYLVGLENVICCRGALLTCCLPNEMLSFRSIQA